MGHAVGRHFTPGQQIAHRSVNKDAGAVLTVLPQIVVRDELRMIVTYLPAGTMTKRRTGVRNGGPRGRQLVVWDGGHEDRAWTGTDVLTIYRPGDGYSLWSAWNAADGQHAWWYVNMEEPWRRTSIGFDSRDLWLDLWREPSAREWHRKDDDELDWAVEAGHCLAGRASEIRAEAERAMEAIAARTPPFDVDWATWRPDPEWPIPRVPTNWSTEPLS